MRWASGVVGAGLVCLLAGCAVTDLATLFVYQHGHVPGDRVVAGSLEGVAHSTQQALAKLNMKAVVSPAGEAIHIDSETRSGARFRLVLSRVDGAGTGERTRVKLEWADPQKTDGNAGRVFAELEGSAK